MLRKTPEQSAADDALEEAVKAVVGAYNLTADRSMIADYIVVGETIKFDEDGDEECGIFVAWRNGHGRITTTIGLFDLGRRHVLSRLETTFDSEDEEDGRDP
jgi:hypothetical protein